MTQDVLSFGQSADTGELPHAFPRPGATRVFENGWVTAWDVTWTPRVPTALHRHRFDYVGVELVDSNNAFTDANGVRRLKTLERGASYFLPRGTTHIEEGLSSDPPRHAIIVDMKDTPAAVFGNGTEVQSPYGAACKRKPAETSRVILWDCTWAQGAPAEVSFRRRNAVVVVLDPGELSEAEAGERARVSAVATGQVLFWPGGHTASVGAARGTVRAIVFELE